MSLRLSGIDVPSAIVNLEFQLQRTQRLLEWVLANNHGLVAIPQEVFDKIARESLMEVQKKYPTTGVIGIGQGVIAPSDLQKRGE